MSADYLPTAPVDALHRRAELLAKTRRFFDSRGFLEVETPLLSHDTVVDRHLDPIPVTLFRDPRQPQHGETVWLQTSPEFGMKRLLASVGRGSPDPALTAIYQITKAFRGGSEVGPLHNPEFTIVEWYRVGDDYAAGRALLADLADNLLGFGRTEELSYREAFLRHASVDPFGDLPSATSFGLPPTADRDLVLDYLLTTRVEPHLGLDRPTTLYDYPPSQAALAQVRAGNPPLAERFELYVRGIELANGYHELLDARALLDRNRDSNHLRAADGKYTLPEDSGLLTAMEHGLPACCGCALGFDRLVMIAMGASSVQEVMAFPIDRA
jgi:lysyl-tRNA synthetase class 2